MYPTLSVHNCLTGDSALMARSRHFAVWLVEAPLGSQTGCALVRAADCQNGFGEFEPPFVWIRWFDQSAGPAIRSEEGGR
jgi:hypothetical protein